MPDERTESQWPQQNSPAKTGPQPTSTGLPADSFRSPPPTVPDEFVIVNSANQVSGLARWLDTNRSASRKTPCTMFVVNRHLLTARHCVKWGSPERVSVASGRIKWSTMREESASGLQATLQIGSGTLDYAVLGPFSWNLDITDFRFSLASKSTPLPSSLILRGHPFNPDRTECKSFLSNPDLMYECGSRPQQEMTCSQVRLESSGEISAQCESTIRSGLSGSPLFDQRTRIIYGVLSSVQSGGRAFFTSVIGLTL